MRGRCLNKRHGRFIATIFNTFKMLCVSVYNVKLLNKDDLKTRHAAQSNLLELNCMKISFRKQPRLDFIQNLNNVA